MRTGRLQLHTDQLLHGLEFNSAKRQQHIGRRHEHYQRGNVAVAECEQCDALHDALTDCRPIGSSAEHGNQ